MDNSALETQPAEWMANCLILSQRLKKINQYFEEMVRKWERSMENKEQDQFSCIADQRFSTSLGTSFASNQNSDGHLQENHTVYDIKTREPLNAATVTKIEASDAKKGRKPLIVYRPEPHDAREIVRVCEITLFCMLHVDITNKSSRFL